jgi:hypothetical protein
MDWNLIIDAAIGLLGAIGGGGVIYWRANRQLKNAEASKGTTEARLAEADLAEQILEKFEKSVLSRMDSGEAVRKQEFKELKDEIRKRFDTIESENRRQNETLRDVVEYLNGGFAKFEENKRKATVKRKKATAQAHA